MIIDKAETATLLEILRDAMRSGRAIEANQIRFVGLGDIKAKAGDKWRRIADWVQQSAETFLRHRLAADDLLIPAEDGFIVIFMDVAQVEARRASLQKAMNEFYIGVEGAPAVVRVQMDEGAISSDLLWRLIGETNPGPRAGAEGAAPQARAVAEARGIAPEFTFAPIWSPAQEMMTSYWLAFRPLDGPHNPFGYVTAAKPEDTDVLDLDLQILAAAVGGLKASIESNRKCLVGFTVHASTMSRPARRRVYMNSLAETPEALRAYLMAQISDVEPGTPVATQTEWVQQIRPFINRVTIEVDARKWNLAGFKDMGLTSVALALDWRQHAGRQRLMAKIRKLARQVKDHHLRLRILGVTDPDILATALDVGADFMSCPTIWPHLAAPAGVRPFSRAAMLKQLRGMAKPGQSAA